MEEEDDTNEPRNRPTWLTGLWLANDCKSNAYWQHATRETWDEARTSKQVLELGWPRHDAARFHLAERLRKEITEAAPTAVTATISSGDTIKALTVWEPYASLLLVPGPTGKRIETRKQPTNHRGLLAIHAGLHEFAGGRVFDVAMLDKLARAFGYSREGVLAYIDALGHDGAPNDASHPVNTREALKSYDPDLFALVYETMAYEGHVDWRFKP